MFISQALYLVTQPKQFVKIFQAKRNKTHKIDYVKPKPTLNLTKTTKTKLVSKKKGNKTTKQTNTTGTNKTKKQTKTKEPKSKTKCKLNSNKKNNSIFPNLNINCPHWKKIT